MLLIQDISLTWGKEVRGSAFARERRQFQMAYPIDPTAQNAQVAVYSFAFVQTAQGIMTYRKLMRQQLEKSLPAFGFPAPQIQAMVSQGCSRARRAEAYSSVQELNLQNLSVLSRQNHFQVNFYYDRLRSGQPFRRGHNKDYWNPQSQLYGQDCLNETAFLLNENQYGRVIWNERKSDMDTGAWYYQIHVYNLLFLTSRDFKPDIFTGSHPDYEYRQLAVLY